MKEVMRRKAQKQAGKSICCGSDLVHLILSRVSNRSCPVKTFNSTYLLTYLLTCTKCTKGQLACVMSQNM